MFSSSRLFNWMAIEIHAIGNFFSVCFARLLSGWEFSPIVIKIHLRMFIACVLNIKHRVLDSRKVREKGCSKNAKTLQFLMLHQTAALGIVFKSLSIFLGFLFLRFSVPKGWQPTWNVSHGTRQKKRRTVLILKRFGCKKCRIYFYGMAINWHMRKIKRKSMSFEFSFVPKNYRSVYGQGWL